MEQTRLSRRRLLVAAGTALSASVAGCVVQAPEEASSRESAPDDADLGDFPDEFETPSGELDDPSADSQRTEVYEAVIDSVGAVEADAPEGQGTTGGTAWMYADELLVTNEHVIRFTDEPYVRFNDAGWREATVVGEDIHSDLAVLEVTDVPESATPLPIVEEPQPVGTPVAAVGSPFDLTGSFTTGVVSGRNRNISVPGRQFSIADGVQTDAALNPGNSGGPLITFNGEVVGVVSAGQGENIGFAISAAMVRRVVPALVERGEFDHSHMGIRLVDVRPAIIEANDLPVSWGVYVAETVGGGPADGVLQESDREARADGQEVPVGGDVIVRMDDWAIPDQERLSAFLALETDPGDTIEIEVVRDGERETVPLTLGTRPDVDEPVP